MKTKEELEADILALTMKIQKEFPELSKYIAEMPHKIPNKDTEELETKNFEHYYSSLHNIYTEYLNSHTSKNIDADKAMEPFPGYPLYPASDDIYNKGFKEGIVNPEDPSTQKAPNEIGHSANEKDFETDRSGDDLDIPGANLDNQQESIGSEDEENNYYSLGGDNHIDLDENRG